MDPFAAATLARMMDLPTRAGSAGPVPPLTWPRAEAEKAARRERLVAEHNEKLQQIVQTFYSGRTSPATVIQTSLAGDVKPAADFVRQPPPASLAPIAIAEMRPGVTHRGRVLRGRLLVEPILMTGMGTLLEDEQGDVVLLGVYNMLPPGLKGLAGQRAAARALPPGQAVAVVEPFFKIFADGSPGVRVDRPNEIIFLESLTPRDVTSLRADGDSHLRAARYRDAADCYTTALLRMPSADGAGSELLTALLTNLSICYLKLDQAAAALRCAAAAVAVRPEAAKAHYRAALALARLGLPLAARCALHRAFKNMPGGGPKAEEWRVMVAGLGSSCPGAAEPPSAKQASAGMEEMLRAMATPRYAADLRIVVPDSRQPSSTGVAEGSSTGCSSVGDSAGGSFAVAAAGAARAPTAGGEGGGGNGASDVSDAAGAMAAAAAAKEAGNAAFRQDRFASAVPFYQQAAAVLLRALPVAPLLTSLADCHQQLAEPRKALAAADAAALLAPSSATAHHRRGSAMLQLSWLAEAEAAVVAGCSAVHPEDDAGRTELMQLQERIQTAERAAGMQGPRGEGGRRGAAAGSSRDGDPGREGEHLREREVEAMRSRPGAVEGTAMLNKMHQMMKGIDPGFAGRMERLRRERPLAWLAVQIDDRVPPFHEEFSKAGRWPPQCDLEECRRQLWDAYELCVGMSRHLILMNRVDGVDPVDFFVKRVGCLGEPAKEQYLWLESAPDGAVSFRTIRGQGYNPTIFHSFSNAVPPAIPMPPPPASGESGSGTGTDGAGGSTPAVQPRTHVAVGFVDLGTLAAAVDLPEWDAAVADSLRELETTKRKTGASASRGGGAEAAGVGAAKAAAAPAAGPSCGPLLRWVGFEASPYAVAKTLVVERMLRRGPEAVEHVLQVWFSAAWSREALTAFRHALTELLQERQRPPPAAALPAAAVSYLRHWQLKDVPLAASRRRWLADWQRTFCLVGQFKEKADRLALCEYMMTGQLPGQATGGQQGLGGSVVMFANPRGGPERALDECFLQALPPDELLAVRAGGCRGSGGAMAAGGSSGSSTQQAEGDIVTAGLAMLRRRVTRLAALLATGRVEVQLHLRAVEPDDPATHAAISSLQPGTISWSNIPDYYLPADFHRMARACSTKGPRQPPAPTAAQPSGSSAGAKRSSDAAHAAADAPGSGVGGTIGTAAASPPDVAATTAHAGSPATVHHVMAMNWPYDIKGGSHLDLLLPYMDKGARGAAGRAPGWAEAQARHDVAIPELEQSILSVFKEGQRSVRQQLAQQAGGRLLFCPPVDNPRNVADFALELRHYKAWVNAFLCAGGLPTSSHSPSQVAKAAAPSPTSGSWAQVTAGPVFAPLSRTNTTICLALCYG